MNIVKSKKSVNTNGTSKFYNEVIVGETKKFLPKKVKNMQSDVVTLKPTQAKHILKYYNSNNRKASSVVATKYATDMVNGNWKTTGQSISFDRNGKLVDGQHRLIACVKTNTPQRFLVVYGLDEDAFEVVDNGKSRTNADVLSMKGYDDPTTLSALVRSIIAYTASGNADARQKAFSGANQITKSQIIEFLEDNPDVIKYIDRYKKTQIVSNSVASFCYWLLCQNGDYTEAEEYLDKVFMGYGLVPNTIENYVFGKLQRNRNALQNKMTKTAQIANVISGWRRVMGYSKTKTIQINWKAKNGLPNPHK